MPRLHRTLSISVLLLGAGCVFESERRPLVDVNAAVASSYVFRGQTFNERPVAQFDTLVQLPTKDGGSASVGAFGNMDLSDNVGDAWADGGHEGEFTQLDVLAGYGRKLGDVDLGVGVRHYSWANAETFRFAPFPSTTEVFARLGGEVLGLGASVTAHYDVDEVTSLYVRGELTRDVSLGAGWSLDGTLWLGWSDSDHSWWLYRTHEAAFADLGGSLGLRCELDDLTTARLAVSGSTIVDTQLRDWFDGKIDADVLWVTASIGWAF